MKIASALLLMASAVQESQVVDDAFDPYVGVITSLPLTNFSQNQERVSEASLNVSTFKVRSTGVVQNYVKLTIVYMVAPQITGLDEIRVDHASFEGGVEADFERIGGDQHCMSLPSGLGCKTTEVLSVRLPINMPKTGSIKVQFRNRTSSWRGMVVVPTSVITQNLSKLPRR